jgi:SAM-dependent methyltransferase
MGPKLTFRREFLDRLLEEAKAHMRGRVLDVGGRKANKRGRFRPPLEAVAAWEYLNPDPAARPDYEGTAESIPLPDGSVGTVVMTEVLEYVSDPGAALREIARVLSPGGACILSTPLMTAIHGDAEWDRYRFTEVALRGMAGAAGLEVVSLQGMGSVGSVIYDHLYAALGYASGGAGGLAYRLGRRALPWTSPLFRWIDKATPKQSAYIHTGYFAVLRKPGG